MRTYWMKWEKSVPSIKRVVLFTEYTESSVDKTLFIHFLFLLLFFISAT